MKVLVCGGRDYNNFRFVYAVMEALHAKQEITLVIHGGMRGADSLADEWATKREIDCLKCPAKWSAQGKAAGPIRNRHMLEFKPDLVVAFPGGIGTLDMTTAAREAGIVVTTYGR